jgi:hypothetical protein
MLARRKNAQIVLVGAIIWLALIAGFLLWVGAGEADFVDAPIATPSGPAPTPTVLPTQP